MYSMLDRIKSQISSTEIMFEILKLRHPLFSVSHTLISSGLDLRFAPSVIGAGGKISDRSVQRSVRSDPSTLVNFTE